MKSRSSLEQVAPLSGVAFAVLGVAGMAITLSGSPDFVGPGDDYVRYYLRHDSDIIIGCIGLILAVFALLWFLGSVRRHLQAAEEGDGRLSSIAFAGGVVAGGMLLGAIAALLAVAFRVDDSGTVSQDVAVALNDLASVLWAVAAPVGFAVLLAATALVGLRYGAGVPKWLAWPSAVLAVLLVVPFISWLAITLVPVWAVVMSVVIYRAQEIEATAQALTPRQMAATATVT